MRAVRAFYHPPQAPPAAKEDTRARRILVQLPAAWHMRKASRTPASRITLPLSERLATARSRPREDRTIAAPNFHTLESKWVVLCSALRGRAL